VAQAVEHLSSKHEAWGSNPNIEKKNQNKTKQKPPHNILALQNIYLKYSDGTRKEVLFKKKSRHHLAAFPVITVQSFLQETTPVTHDPINQK
jgi:hypothetical protein